MLLLVSLRKFTTRNNISLISINSQQFERNCTTNGTPVLTRSIFPPENPEDEDDPQNVHGGSAVQQPLLQPVLPPLQLVQQPLEPQLVQSPLQSQLQPPLQLVQPPLTNGPGTSGKQNVAILETVKSNNCRVHNYKNGFKFCMEFSRYFIFKMCQSSLTLLSIRFCHFYNNYKFLKKEVLSNLEINYWELLIFKMYLFCCTKKNLAYFLTKVFQLD